MPRASCTGSRTSRSLFSPLWGGVGPPLDTSRTHFKLPRLATPASRPSRRVRTTKEPPLLVAPHPHPRPLVPCSPFGWPFSKIIVAVDDTPEEGLEGALRLELLANEVTYTRLKSTLALLGASSASGSVGGPAGPLADVLFGRRPPRPGGPPAGAPAVAWLDPGLDLSQRAAVAFALAAPDVALVRDCWFVFRSAGVRARARESGGGKRPLCPSRARSEHSKAPTDRPINPKSPNPNPNVHAGPRTPRHGQDHRCGRDHPPDGLPGSPRPRLRRLQCGH